LALAFLLGPAVSSLGPLAYLSDHRLYSGLLRNFTLVKRHLSLPGVFENLPAKGVNGSLWTLPAEFLLYVLLGGFGAAGILFSRRWYGLFILSCCVAATLLSTEVRVFMDNAMFLRLFLLFALGSVMRIYADRIPLDSWVFGALSLVMLLGYGRTGFEYLFTAWLAYAVFWAAYVPKLHGFNRLGDYSYGLYIYAFPIEQTLRQYIPAIQPLELFLCASLLTLGCAMLSWHFVERPALELKKMKFREFFRSRIAASD
jgi:peptidoglycan/LPS O-acetylase OafA/YrhL